MVRGGCKTILSEATSAPPQPRIDIALLKALARADRWRRMIEGGEFANYGTRQGTGRQRVLRLPDAALELACTKHRYRNPQRPERF